MDKGRIVLVQPSNHANTRRPCSASSQAACARPYPSLYPESHARMVQAAAQQAPQTNSQTHTRSRGPGSPAADASARHSKHACMACKLTVADVRAPAHCTPHIAYAALQSLCTYAVLLRRVRSAPTAVLALCGLAGDRAGYLKALRAVRLAQAAQLPRRARRHDGALGVRRGVPRLGVRLLRRRSVSTIRRSVSQKKISGAVSANNKFKSTTQDCGASETQ